MKLSELQKQLDEQKLLIAADKQARNAEMEELKKGLAQKQEPIQLEREILSIAQKAIGEAIKNTLTGYSNPLTKIVSSVVEENAVFLRQLIAESFNQVIKTEDFKQSIVDAFSHKIARSIISNNEGLFDKVSNELKQDPTFRAKLTLAVANVVEECLNK